MTAEVEAAKEFAFSLNDLLTGLAVLLSLIAIYVSHFMRWSKITIAPALTPESFTTVGKTKARFAENSQEITKATLAVNYDLLAFATGNASVLLESVSLVPDDDAIDRRRWPGCKISESLTADSVSVFKMQIRGDDISSRPELHVTDLNDEVYEFTFNADIYTPDGHCKKVVIPVKVFLMKTGNVEKVECSRFTLKYRSPILPPGLKEFFTGK